MSTTRGDRGSPEPCSRKAIIAPSLALATPAGAAGAVPCSAFDHSACDMMHLSTRNGGVVLVDDGYIPRVVAVQPRRIIVAAGHPCIGAGNLLNAGCAR